MAAKASLRLMIAMLLIGHAKMTECGPLMRVVSF